MLAQLPYLLNCMLRLMPLHTLVTVSIHVFLIHFRAPTLLGTGSNLEYFAANLNHFAKVMVLDLCPSLAAQAEERVKRHPGWSDFVEVRLGGKKAGRNKKRGRKFVFPPL